MHNLLNPRRLVTTCRLGGLAAILLVAIGAGCGAGAGSPTGIDLTVEVDEALSLDTVDITMRAIGKTPRVLTRPSAESILVRIVTEGLEAGAIVNLDVSGVKNGTPAVLARAQAKLRRAEIVRATVRLTKVCEGILSCQVTETCSAGVCVAISTTADAGTTGSGGQAGAGTGGAASDDGGARDVSGTGGASGATGGTGAGGGPATGGSSIGGGPATGGTSPGGNGAGGRGGGSGGIAAGTGGGTTGSGGRGTGGMSTGGANSGGMGTGGRGSGGAASGGMGTGGAASGGMGTGGRGTGGSATGGSTPCGAIGQPCCGSTCTSTSSTCSGGACMPCGGLGQPCCGSSCATGFSCSGSTCECAIGTHRCSSATTCALDSDVQNCGPGPSCYSCDQPNAVSACGQGKCANTCVGGTAGTLCAAGTDGKPSCGRWDFESATAEGWEFDPTMIPATFGGVGTPTTTTTTRLTGSRSLALSFNSTGGSKGMYVRVKLCWTGQGVDIYGKTFSRSIRFVTAPDSPKQFRDLSTNWYTLEVWQGNQAQGSADFVSVTSEEWVSHSRTISDSFPGDGPVVAGGSAVVTHLGIFFGATDWKGTIYLDDLRLQ